MKRFPNHQLETKVFNRIIKEQFLRILNTDVDMKNFETADTDTDMTFYDFGVIQTEIDSGSRYGEYV